MNADRYWALCLLTLCACGLEPSSGQENAVVKREAEPIAKQVMPEPRAGSDLIGQRVAAMLPTRWLDEPVEVTGKRAAKATLIRFWTDSCPYCKASLPALEQLRNQYSESGLQTVGVYHPKPPRPVSDDKVRRAARRLSYEGPVAIDERWDSLRAIWLDTGDRQATSSSILCDAEGIVRFVHPGPEFHPSDESGHELCDRDYRDLEAAIEVLLNE